MVAELGVMNGGKRRSIRKTSGSCGKKGGKRKMDHPKRSVKRGGKRRSGKRRSSKRRGSKRRGSKRRGSKRRGSKRRGSKRRSGKRRSRKVLGMFGL